MSDPDLSDLQAVLARAFGVEFDDFDRAEAIYWFANDYHGGQASNLYSVLSTSEFSPGPITFGPSESAAILYDELVAAFFPDDLADGLEESAP